MEDAPYLNTHVMGQAVLKGGHAIEIPHCSVSETRSRGARFLPHSEAETAVGTILAMHEPRADPAEATCWPWFSHRSGGG